MVKCCRTCGAIKPIKSFYKDRRMADGHINNCKVCEIARTQAYKARNLEKVQAYDREKAKRPYYRGLSNKRKRASNKAYPERVRARYLLREALRKGQVTRPATCAICDKPKRVVAHHEDYSKPLEVEWLCYSCHGYKHVDQKGKA